MMKVLKLLSEIILFIVSVDTHHKLQENMVSTTKEFSSMAELVKVPSLMLLYDVARTWE